MPALSPRLFVGIVGAGLIVVGLIALSITIKVDYDAGILGHNLTGCGTTFVPDGNLSGKLAVDCDAAISSRRMWAWPILVGGVLAMLGAAFVRPAPRQSVQPET